ncbi:MAG: membrane protein [Candidatus Hydrogenedentota bacterium]
MSGARLEHPEWLWFLWSVPVLIVLFAYSAARRKSALRAYADAALLYALLPPGSAMKRIVKAGCLVAAVVLISLALARPVWNPQPETVTARGRDVVFLLDVSRSMLAEDLKPNRLERAKLAIQDCVESLDGDRVGLVAFAGTSVVKCPLTMDYGFFRMILQDVSPDSVSRGGTQIGDAVRTAVDSVFNDENRVHRDIILITDGEDHESEPVKAAEEAAGKDIRIIAIGLGDDHQGARIPVIDEQQRKGFLTHEGVEVWSKLNGQALRDMVAATPGGRYLNVATGTFDLGQVYRDLVTSEEKNEEVETTLVRYSEGFQWLLGPALVFLLIEGFLRDRRRVYP